MNKPAVPNPATPRHLRPVELITDRAKRYRANQTPPEGPRRCGFCGGPRPRDIDHIDGFESNGARRNLQYLCRPCNVRKANTQRAQGTGERTRQYNPDRAPGFEEYVNAVLTLRGDLAGDARHAAQVLQATPPEARSRFVKRIWQARQNPEGTDRPPTFAEYCAAVAMHIRGNHDTGGRIIHATPKALRSEYAREIARLKKQRRPAVPF